MIAPWQRAATLIRVVGFALAAVVVACVLSLAVLGHNAGWQLIAVGGGSMQPSIAFGSVILVRPVGATGVAPGEIVVFRTDHGRTTHRLVSTLPDGGLVTKGDANRVTDPAPVAATDVEGRVVATLPFAGLLVVSQPVRQAAVLVLIMIAGLGLLTVGRARPPD